MEERKKIVASSHGECQQSQFGLLAVWKVHRLCIMVYIVDLNN